MFHRGSPASGGVLPQHDVHELVDEGALHPIVDACASTPIPDGESVNLGLYTNSKRAVSGLREAVAMLVTARLSILRDSAPSMRRRAMCKFRSNWLGHEFPLPLTI